MSASTTRTLSSAISRASQISRQVQQRTTFTAQQQIRMASQTTHHTLNTGAKIPAVGFGTWQDKDEQAEAVYTALKNGYRHIDTARIYGTEPAVGEGIRKSGVPRDQIFLVTKLWNNSHDPSHVEAALDASLKDLGTDYVDLYLMHWPSAFKAGPDFFPKDGDNKTITANTDYLDTYKAMEECQRKGKAKAIGVSNFSQKEVERLVKEASIVPAAHQLEIHPWLAQAGFDAFHKKHGIHLTQYSPFGNSNPIYSKGQELGKLIQDPVLAEIGKKYNKSGAQVALAWGIAHGRSVIPKSKTEARIKQNLEGDFVLEPEDVKKVDAMDKKLRFNNPSEGFGYKFYADLDGVGN